MSSYVVGFDTLGYYVPNVLGWLRDGLNFWRFIATAPLLYLILIQATSLGIPLILTLKIMAPLIHGFLGLAIYFYASRALAWSQRKSLFVALFATLYFVALRISWDMLRNELGLVLLFVTLSLLQKKDQWRGCAMLSLAMSFVVLAHQLVAVIMFAVIAFTIAHMLLAKRFVEARNLVVTSMPATLLFLLIVYANYTTSPNFAAIGSFPSRKPDGWLALFGFASYQDMVINTLGFLFYCYLPIIPLAVMGVRHLKNLQVESWVLWGLAAALSPIISPNAFIPGGYRWTLMLVFPLAFYAADALVRLKSDMHRWIVSLVLVVMTLSFVTMPYESAFPYYALFPYYVPSSMLQNTAPLSDCQDTLNALQWLKGNVHGNAHLLTHDAFHGWALLVLNEDQIISYGYENPEEATQEALQNGYNPLYLIWWTNGNGWHGQPTVSPSFKEVFRSGRIAIYVYVETH